MGSEELWSRLASAWLALSFERQCFYLGSAFLVVAFALLLWTPLGNRKVAGKCVFLAVLLHFLAWGGLRHVSWEGASAAQPERSRVRLRMRHDSITSKGLFATVRDPRGVVPTTPMSSSVADTLATPRRSTSEVAMVSVALPTERLVTVRAATPSAQATAPTTAPVVALAGSPHQAPKFQPLAPAEAPATRAKLPDLPKRKRLTATMGEATAMPLAPSAMAVATAPVAAPVQPGDILPQRELAPAPLPTTVKSLIAQPANVAVATSPLPKEAPLTKRRADASLEEPDTLLPSELLRGLTLPTNKGSNEGVQVASITPATLGQPVPMPSARPTPFPHVYSQRVAENRAAIVKRHGGSPETEKAVDEALRWLAAHQDDDGLWSCAGFHRHCPLGDRCLGPAFEKGSDMGVTGIVLLAFLGAGHTHLKSPKYMETVRTGLNALLDRQKPDGDLRGTKAEGRIYSHAMATLALTESFAMTKDERMRPYAQSAIDWLVAAQHADSGGWRYAPGHFGDTSVFGWAMMALYSAENAGLKVPPRTWELARRWLPLVSSGPNGGLAAYQPTMSPSHSMTAEALVCRQWLGQPRSDPAQEEAGDYLLARLPNVNDYHLYYWYYGTLAMFQLGGTYWERWNSQLKVTLLATQEKNGHQRGSWAPEKPFGIDGGRVFTTACSALCLETYYRFLPLYAESGKSSATPREPTAIDANP